jgi:hypothetical protein
MKYLTGVICLVILAVSGCASSGEVAAPNLDSYQAASLNRALSLISQNQRDNKNFTGYFYTQDLVVMSVQNNRVSVSAVPIDTLQGYDNSAFRRIVRRESVGAHIDLSDPYGTGSNLVQFNIITVWYRAIYRRPQYNRGIREEAGIFIDRLEVTGNFVKEPTAADIAAAEREAERTAPRFSPEGQQYISRTLLQAAGEANNSANRGKTLFFQTERIRNIREGAMPGQWFVTELGGTDIPTTMWFYDRIPFGVSALFYRVEISNIGVIRYTIDSFR